MVARAEQFPRGGWSVLSVACYVLYTCVGTPLQASSVYLWHAYGARAHEPWPGGKLLPRMLRRPLAVSFLLSGAGFGLCAQRDLACVDSLSVLLRAMALGGLCATLVARWGR